MTWGGTWLFTCAGSASSPLSQNQSHNRTYFLGLGIKETRQVNSKFLLPISVQKKSAGLVSVSPILTQNLEWVMSQEMWQVCEHNPLWDRNVWAWNVTIYCPVEADGYEMPCTVLSYVWWKKSFTYLCIKRNKKNHQNITSKPELLALFSPYSANNCLNFIISEYLFCKYLNNIHNF